MDEPIKMYRNMIWNILDEGSKLTVIGILMQNGFSGDCKLISKVDSDTTVMEVSDNYGHQLILPINILDILND